MKYKELFSPVKVGSITLKNRFAMAPMGPLGLADANGGWNQRGIDYYVERAKGGTGLIITGVTFFDQIVEKQDPSTVPNPLYKPVHFVRTSREMTERVHAYGSKIFLQLSGGFGRVTIPTNVGDIPLLRLLPSRTAGWTKSAAKSASMKSMLSLSSSGKQHSLQSELDLTVCRFTPYTKDI